MIKKLLCFLFVLLIVQGCGNKKTDNDKKTVVVYTAHDQIFSEPILKSFEEKTGIFVKTVFDTESTKTIGLVNRILAEKNNPRCDVFWNNELANTILLKEQGLLSPYKSHNFNNIPDGFKDQDGMWTGFAARFRVILVNTDIVSEQENPGSILDLLNPKWKGKIGIANPLFGTTATYASSLFITLGDNVAKEVFAALKANEIKILDGNAVVKNEVASGNLALGLTDSDDANIAKMIENKPVRIVIPDMASIGTLLIPNSVAIIDKAPHQEEAKQLVDYLTSPEVEARLAMSQAAQIPLQQGVSSPPQFPSLKSMKVMNVSYTEIAHRINEVRKYLEENFIR